MSVGRINGCWDQVCFNGLSASFSALNHPSIVTKLNINDIIFSNVSTGDIYENEISDNFVGRRTR